MKLKDRVSLFSFFFRSSCMKYAFLRIKEQVDEKRSTVSIHRNADSLLKNTLTKHSKYFVNQKHKHSLNLINIKCVIEKSSSFYIKLI